MSDMSLHGGKNRRLNGETISAEEAAGAFLLSLADDKSNDRVRAILNRERKKTTFGNLTLVHYGVNRSLQHSAFDKKREVLFKESNLHLNRELMVAPDWSEDAIEERGRKLFEIARTIWTGPQANAT